MGDHKTRDGTVLFYVHGEFALLHRHVVADAVLGLAGRMDAHHRRVVVFVRGDDGFVEVVRHRATGLRHERVRVHHANLREFLAPLDFAGNCFAVNGELGVLAHVALTKTRKPRVCQFAGNAIPYGHDCRG